VGMDFWRWTRSGCTSSSMRRTGPGLRRVNGPCEHAGRIAQASRGFAATKSMWSPSICHLRTADSRVALPKNRTRCPLRRKSSASANV